MSQCYSGNEKKHMVYCTGMYITQENLENIAGNHDRYDNYF